MNIILYYYHRSNNQLLVNTRSHSLLDLEVRNLVHTINILLLDHYKLHNPILFYTHSLLKMFSVRIPAEPRYKILLRQNNLSNHALGCTYSQLILDSFE
jgi:hypothetical protein